MPSSHNKRKLLTQPKKKKEERHCRGCFMSLAISLISPKDRDPHRCPSPLPPLFMELSAPLLVFAAVFFVHGYERKREEGKKKEPLVISANSIHSSGADSFSPNENRLAISARLEKREKKKKKCALQSALAIRHLAHRRSLIFRLFASTWVGENCGSILSREFQESFIMYCSILFFFLLLPLLLPIRAVSCCLFTHMRDSLRANICCTPKSILPQR